MTLLPPYTKLGSGPNILLAFHGIGQDGPSCFAPVLKPLGSHYTIYAFDLPFHGHNSNAPFEVISKTAWKESIQSFLTQNNITRFDVTGFSIGGRFALATLEAFPERIDNAFLIAPDGVSEHPMYALATRIPPARWIYGWLMRHPEVFFPGVRVARTLKLASKSLVRFTQQVLNTPEKRQTIYRSWVAFRDLRFDIPKLAKTAKTNGVTIYLFAGVYDSLLKPKAVRPLAALLPENQYIELKSGHTRLVEHSATWICTLFK
ncbi:Pimeloyl-ACP methyl ester carboxylesterase [Dyadobacter soli]|uniref:Pimeloyl-ACP methyl ester carboxylesterase n=1 Tax=Dyadobacter soli TaxID=659014 RepID=A0A1G7QG07_9BACT|nr:alpha/beta fold hydrolase [Dyadobacter soli]SDF97473.1 Pimeloyl-ACP methyl ester carboxylesterase [Dyadobacter soli]